MKKLVSFVLILSMLCSMLAVPIFASDTTTATTYQRGDVLYEQDFTNFDVSTLTPYGYAATAGGALSALEVKDGALRIDSSNLGADAKSLGGRYGTRVELYAIPDDVMRYSIEMDLYIDAYHASTASQGPALIIADNGITDASTSEKLSEFSMFWFRTYNKGTTGTYTYGDTSQNVVSQTNEGFCEAGTWYHLEMYIDRTELANRWGTFRATNMTTGAVYEHEGFGFNPLAHKAIVGLYNNGTDTKYDNIKVTYGDAYFGNVDTEADSQWGTNVLYEQDFSGFDVASVTPYGFAAANGGALTNFEVVDGALRINSSNLGADGKSLGGRYGTRVELYAIPDDVMYYSIEMDMFIDAYHASTASQGPALILADNGITDASTAEKLSEFSMFWFRTYNKGTTGTYTYGDTSQNVVSQTNEGFCEAGTWYHLEIYIDRSDIASRWGTFRATNKTTGAVYEHEGFGFNPLAHKAIVGLYNNGTDTKFDNIKVTYGDAYFGNAAPGSAVDEPDEPVAPLELTSPEAPKVTESDVLYSQDFSYYTALTETIYGYGGVNGALKTYETVDGILHFDSSMIDASGKSLGGRYGSRVKLYEIPKDVTEFSISADFYINEYHAETASSGPALLLADNGITDESATATLAEFSMFWMRQFGIGTTGAYTYGDTSLNVVSQDEVGICLPGCWYRVQIYVDNSNPLDPTGMFRITNLDTKDVYETDWFCYNVRNHTPIVGLYNNGTDTYVDNIYVVKGNAFLEDLVPEPVVTEPIQTTEKEPDETEPIETSVSETETIAPETSVSEPGEDPVEPTEPSGGISPIVIVVVAVVLVGGCVACFFLIKDNKIKYIIIGVIAVALVVFVIIAATAGGKQTDDGTTPGDDVSNDTTTTAPIGDVTGSDTTPAETELTHNLPEMDLGGEPFNILYWEEISRYHNEFDAEMQNGDLFNDSKYARNLQIEELFGTTLQFNKEVQGDANHAAEYIAFMNNVYNSGSKEFDLIAGYSQTMCTLSSQGMFYDLTDTMYLDFEQPWWPQNLVEDFTINDKLYVVTGDVAPSTLYYLYVTYFNKDMIEEFKLENPHDLVLDGKWTIDKMIEMTKGLYADLNGDGLKNLGDRFGYSTGMLHLDAFMYSVGGKIAEKDAAGNLIISPSFGGEKVMNTIGKLQTLLHSSQDGLLADNRNDSAYSYQSTAFAENQVLFITEGTEKAPLFNVDNLTYGVLPVPKYDEEQDDYISLIRNYITMYAIPNYDDDPVMVSAVMEALAFYSYKEIGPAVFEQSFQLKYSDTEVDSEMYDIVRRTVTFDIGRWYSKVLIGQGDFRTAIGNNNSRWASVVRSKQTTLQKGLEDLQEAFED